MATYNNPSSPSSVNMFLSCAYSFKLKYINKIKFPSGEAAQFGSAIHKVLEMFWSEYTLYQDIEKAMQESINKHWDRNISDEYEDASHACLNNAMDLIKERENILPLYVEYPCLNEEKNTIAIIDLVLPHKIIDYKTGKYYTKEAKEPAIIQATMCSMNLEKLTGRNIRHVEFEYLRIKKNQYVDVTDQMILDANLLIEKIRRDISNDVFPKNEKNCFMCDYSSICKAEKRMLSKYKLEKNNV
jgi:CRISPR/Cas system-associated exonuclease Cas4 (RecB family)